MKSMKWLVFFMFIFFQSYAISDDCYNPLKEEMILKIYGEDFMSDIAPLLRMAHARLNTDPRIIFHRMVGEARGNPDIKNKSSGAYGIFQFLGAFYKKEKHTTRVKKMYPKNSTKYQRQFTQVKYYVESFLTEAIQAAGYSDCRSTKKTRNGKKNWELMSTLHKITYLGWGSCKEWAITDEMGILNGDVLSYVPRIALSIPGMGITPENEIPLCEDW
jgi:hypothetical protein